jgi:hypothetical protein
VATKKLAIYEPPDDELPYLVLSIDKKGYDVFRVDTRKEARVLVSELRRKEKKSEKE